MIPVIETERLVLRGPAAADAEAYCAFFATERSRWVGGLLDRDRAWRSFATHIGHWQLCGFGMWAVTLRGKGQCLGMVGCWCPEGWPEREIGWFIFGGAEGRGIAGEAATAARRHAYEAFGWKTAVSYIDPANHRSRALARRLGAEPDPDAAPPPGLGHCLVFRHPAPEAVAA